MRSVLGMNPWTKQVEIARAVFEHRRVAVRGCVSSSKTNAAAMTALAWVFAYQPSRVFTLAPSYRQVETNLWGEMRDMHAKARRPLGGKMMETTEFKLGKNWYALGFSTKDKNMVHGIHGRNDLLIVDDAHGIDKELFDEIENMMAGGNTHVLMLYNPAVLAGLTYDCTHDQAHLWHNIKIADTDTPNFTEGRIVYPGMLHPEQAGEWRRKYGPDSNFCRVKLDAEYPNQESDTLIPLDWIEKASMREVPETAKATDIGVDVARFGDDDSVIAVAKGRRILPLEARHGQDTMATVGWVKAKRREIGARKIYVDAIGLGAGVVDRLKEQGEPVHGINVAESPVGKQDDQERFTNLRSQIWWFVRESLNPDNPNAVAIPKDPDLQAELSSVKYKIDSDGRIRVESKEDMKKRLGKSPDRADAIGLVLFGASGMLQSPTVWRPLA
jgi:hypothetical protein